MKNVQIQFSFDEEKLNAIRLFLSQKNMTLDDELVTYMETLYRKYVPSTVREYIGLVGSLPVVKKSKMLVKSGGDKG